MSKEIGGIDKKIKKRKKSVIILFMVFLTAVSFILVFRTDIFSIKSVDITGNSILSKEHIVYYSGIILSNNIFKERISSIEKNLLMQPYIKQVKVKRAFPDGIKIEIEERKQTAYVPFMGNYIIIDNEGYVLETTLNSEGLMLMKGLDFSNFNEGDILNVKDKHQLDKALEIIRELEIEGLSIKELDMTNTENIRMNISDMMVCTIGKGVQLNYKIKVLRNILTDLADKEIVRGIIDISHEGYPSYRPVE